LAVHADASGQLTAPADQAGDDIEAAGMSSADGAAVESTAGTEPPVRQPLSSLRRALMLCLVMLLALSGLFAWLGSHAYETKQAQQQRDRYLEVGRQAAINLTTIGADTAETDVARILDSATGAFHDDWAQRAHTFVEVVRKAQAKTSGSVTAAGLESDESDKARVLVAVSVTTTTAGMPEQKPRAWRMRIDVQKVGDNVKVANVEFVP
jgi:Mce-associated membrane protein